MCHYDGMVVKRFVKMIMMMIEMREGRRKEMSHRDGTDDDDVQVCLV